MIDYLAGALPWLRRRATLLLNRLRALNIPGSIQSRIQIRIVELEDTIDTLLRLLNDPTLTHPGYIDQNLTTYRQMVRTVDQIERIFLPLVERWNTDEERMQQLLTRICQEANLPNTVQPIIALYSPEYFFVLENLHVIYMPRLEPHFLLHLPDLYHEVGHVVLEQELPALWGSFQSQIQNHFNQKHLQGTLTQDPLASSGAYLYLADAWMNRWMIEFTCDIFATSLCGPAYGWSHVHLCASKGDSSQIYHPNVGEDALHPADEARWRVMAMVLDDMGWTDEKEQIEQRWRSLIASLSESEPTNFHIAYPANLLSDLQQQIQRGLMSLNVVLYSESSIRHGNTQRLASRLNEAWRRFWEDPASYASWEENALPLGIEREGR